MIGKIRKPLMTAAAAALALGACLGFTGTAQAAEMDGSAATRNATIVTPYNFDRGHPNPSVPSHHYGPYKSLRDCRYALADQSGGGRNVARSCMKENDGRYYYWGWGAGERH